ncbi:MAG: DUF362 domain-containing protein [Ignavibacteriae bacterium]|nr:DUF362 domain-containing protein [Ignavibacteriota bacterium]
MNHHHNTQTIKRRRFLKDAAFIGTTALAGTTLLRSLTHATDDSQSTTQSTTESPIDLAIIETTNNYDGTIAAVERLGGIKKFVQRGSRVGLLVNSRFDKQGTYVKPEIALAVIAMCHNAGAKEIVSLEDVSSSYWRKATLTKELREYTETLVSPSRGETTLAIKDGKSLKEAEIARDLLECDVYINLPIIKDHVGTQFTGAMKNVMGATSGSTNRYFHHGSGASGYYDDVEFLSRCIAEVNLLRKPTLCIADVTEVVITNGPFGPGRIARPRKIIAGADMVAVDAYGSTLLNLNPTDVLTIRYGAELGLGRTDIENLSVHTSKI